MTMKAWTLPLLACFFLLGCGGGTHGSGDVGVYRVLLTGEVVDVSGRPFPGVRVASSVDSQLSDSAGKFNILTDPAGENSSWTELSISIAGARESSLMFFVPSSSGQTFKIRISYNPGVRAELLDFDVVEEGL